MPPTSQVRPRFWNRPIIPSPFQLQTRDIEILRAVHLHRFLKPEHIQLLLGGSHSNLSRRCRLLWQHCYLERPRALRPLKLLTEEIVYALGKKGAELLEHLDPKLRIACTDWTETNRRQVGWPYVDHQLGVATFLVTVQAACNLRGIHFRWDGQVNRKQYILKSPGGTVVQPDGYFVLETPDHKVTHQFLELDRGNVSLSRMQERYRTYFEWWKNLRNRPQQSMSMRFGSELNQVRILTITIDHRHTDSLRNVAIPIGRNRSFRSTWKGLMFSSLESINLKQPDTVLSPIFRHADQDNPVSLV